MLLPACAYVVHQLRYTLAYGSQANQMLAATGHSYLDSLAPWLVLMLGAALGTFLLRLARSLATTDVEGSPRSFLRLTGATWLSLVALYTTQEFLEGFFAAGHPGGLGGIFGHGGWWAPIVALPVALALAALLRAAHALVRVAARRLAPGRPGRSTGPLRRLSATVRATNAPLASSAAGRAPPLGFVAV
jgi:hypothetical protein